jgi:excisionase family DNA binding protein
MSNELVTVTQAADIMGISRSTVEYLIRRGDLTPLRLPPQGRLKGRKMYLHRAEVERVKHTWRRQRPRGQEE